MRTGGERQVVWRCVSVNRIAWRRMYSRVLRMRIGFTAFAVLILPTQIGYQDLAALLARQPAVAARWQRHIIASPFGTIHAATFSFPRPIGSGMPDALSYGMRGVDGRG